MTCIRQFLLDSNAVMAQCLISFPETIPSVQKLLQTKDKLQGYEKMKEISIVNPIN
jgi:hypothetical protein